MVNFFKNKNKKKSKVVRELPKPCSSGRVILGKKREKVVCSRPKSFYIKILVWFLAIVFLGATIYIFFFSGFLRISEIEIAGTETLSQGDLRRSLSLEMEGKNSGVFNRDNLIFFDSQAAKDVLLEKYKIIRSLDIQKRFPNKLIVNIRERKSSLVYCIQGKCSVVDEEGKIFAPADFSQGKLGENSLLVLLDESNKSISENNFIMDLDFMQFMSDVKNQSDLNDIKIKNTFSTPTLVSGDLRVETEDGWKIYFNDQLRAEEEMEMLKTVLKNSIPEEQRKDLEYIDVRLADKVYYKLRTNPEESSDQVVTEEHPQPDANADTSKKDSKKKKK